MKKLIYLLPLFLFAACQDKNNAPDALLDTTLSGKITCMNNKPMSGVSVILEMSGAPAPIVAITDASGNYTFENIALGSTGVIYPYKEIPVVSAGFSASELQYLRDEVLSQGNSLTPFQLLAAGLTTQAEVDALSSFDFATLSQTLNNPPFNWRFATPDFTQAGTGRLDKVGFADVQSALIFNFVGVQYGDVDGSNCN